MQRNNHHSQISIIERSLSPVTTNGTLDRSLPNSVNGIASNQLPVRRQISVGANEVCNAARMYLQRGMMPVPVPLRQKGPRLKGWQNLRLHQSEITKYFCGKCNIGILLGSPSDNLVDVDLDCDEAIEFADRFLPPTPAKTGHPSSPRSHWWYIAPDVKTKRYEDAKSDMRKMIVELRSTGSQTLVGPSIHPSGEKYDILEGVPVCVDGKVLAKSVFDLAQAVREARYGKLDPECVPLPENTHRSILPENTNRPGDDYNHCGEVRKLLEEYGWVCIKNGEEEHWRRPGIAYGKSATLKDRCFYVFSSNAAPFESGQSYSPFAIYTLLTCDGDYKRAAQSLRQLGYGNNHQGNLSVPESIPSVVRPIVSSDIPQTGIADPGLLPDEMLRIPGFVSEVMDHSLEAAPYPNPVLAFCGALSLLAFLAGRKVRDSGDNRTNLYMLGLAHSSAGKDFPRKVNTDILHEVGLSKNLGEQFASGEGIQDALLQTPCMLFQTDEFDSMLQSINKSKDARHEPIMRMLLTMYSSANSVYPMRRKAGKEPIGEIDQPCLVIFGTAIPTHYYQALNERMITNGLFARMLIFEAGRRGCGQEPGIPTLPIRVIETAKKWVNMKNDHRGFESNRTIPHTLQYSEAAKQMVIEVRKEAEVEYSKAEAAQDPVGTTVWGRVSEQVRKLALLYAISIDYHSSIIDTDAVRWASQLVMHQTRRMLFMAREHVSTSEHDGRCKELLRVLRRWRDKHGDEWMPFWKINRVLSWSARDHQDVRMTLLNQVMIEYSERKTGGTPQHLYRIL